MTLRWHKAAHLKINLLLILCGLTWLLMEGQSTALALDDQTKVDKVFDRYNRNDSPGRAVGVLKAGDLIYSKAYGLASVESALPIGAMSLFNIGSMSKQFTAMSILLLERGGKLKLTDDLRLYLPEMPAYPTPITIRNLLEHSSGLRDESELLKLAGFHTYEDLITNRDYLQIAAKQKALNFSPGEDSAYSDTGYMLLGQIVERLSGMSLRQFETENIFRPLGMNSTVIRDDRGVVVKGNTSAYIRDAKGQLRTGVTNDESTGPGNVLTSIEDYAKWDRNFYTYQVGGADLITRMQTPGSLKSGAKSPYGLGLQLGRYRGLSTVEHGGADAGYHSFYLRFPGKQFSVVVLCNVRDYAGPSPSMMAKQTADIYLAGSLENVQNIGPGSSKSASHPIAIPTQELKSYVGPYFNPKDGSVIKFDLAGDALAEIDDITDPTSSAVLTPLGRGQFVGPQEMVFNFAKRADRTEVTKITGDETAHFVSADPPVTTASALSEMAGTYHSDEVGSTWIVVVQDGQLVLRRHRFPDETLLPVFRDGFYSEQWTIVFSRGKDGKVAALTVTNERLHDISFDKTSAAAGISSISRSRYAVR